MTLPADCLWTHPRAPSAKAALTLGCMNFGARTPEPESMRILERAVEVGITTFDTANVYTDGNSERIVGSFLRSRPHLRVATKVGFLTSGGKVEGLSRKRIEAAIDESLGRLQRDSVDLYYLHVPDPAVPFEETLDAIQVLLEKKKIQSWGVSNFASWQILEMMHRCDTRSMPRPLVSQVIYNLAIRQIEVEYLAFAQRYALHTTIFNPLAGGLLAGKHRQGAPEKGTRFDGNPLYQRRYWSDRMFHFVEDLKVIAREANLSLVDLAYAWTAAQPGVDSILVGPATVEHLDAAVAGCARALPEPALARVRALQVAFDGTDARYAR